MKARPWLICWIGLFLSSIACGDNSAYWNVNWEKNSAEAWLGLPHILTLISANGPNDLTLKISASRDWKIEEQQVQSLKGDTPLTVFRLNCTALIAGEVALPKMELFSQQGQLSVPDFKIKVNSPEVHKNSQIDLHFSKSEVYVGEALKLTAKWTTTFPLEAIKALKWIIPVLEHPDIRVVEVRQLGEPDESKSIGLPIGQRRMIGTWASGQLNGEQAHALSFEILLQPQKAGELNLRPSFLVNSVERDLSKYNNKKWRGNRYPSYFNNNFFETTQDKDDMKRTICLSQPHFLKVKDLPSPPNKVKGSIEVGLPKISLSAEPKKLKVGEPLHLEITVEHEFPEVFNLPALNSMEAFDRNFKTPDDRSPATYNNHGQKVYRQTLWPKRSNLTMIPPIVLNCFEPTTGFYRESTSNSIKIEVTGGETSAFDMAEFAGNIVIKSTVEADPEGIWHHVWKLSHHPEFSQSSSNLWRWALVAITLLVFIAQFTPLAWQNFRIWQYDSYTQKAKRFKRDLQAWRNQSLDRQRLRSLVLDHLSQHIKIPKSRYDETILLEHLELHQLDPTTLQEFKAWLDDQTKQFDQNASLKHEGDAQELVLRILRRTSV